MRTWSFHMTGGAKSPTEISMCLPIGQPNLYGGYLWHGLVRVHSTNQVIPSNHNEFVLQAGTILPILSAVSVPGTHMDRKNHRCSSLWFSGLPPPMGCTGLWLDREALQHMGAWPLKSFKHHFQFCWKTGRDFFCFYPLILRPTTATGGGLQGSEHWLLLPPKG